MTINGYFASCTQSNGFLMGMRESQGFCFTHDGEGGRPEAAVDVELLPECAALRYRGEIRNAGNETTGRVCDIHMVCLSFSMERTGQPTVHGAGGGPADSSYPPRAFRRFADSPMAGVCGSAEYGSSMGLSSNETLPFFVVSDEAESCGLFLALGWSGNWKASFSVAENAAGDREFRIRCWLPSVDALLLPGEAIPIPEVLIGFYAGAPVDGMNALRRTLLTRFSPELAGDLPLPPVVYSTWFANGGCRGAERLNEETLKRQADIAACIGCEVFEIDLGWEEGSENIASFDDRRMDWEPSKAKFPHGLESFSGYVRSKGMRFGLWFDIARTTRSSRVSLEHPDWVLWQAGGSSVAGIINFGLPEARDWALSVVSGIIRRYGVQWVRMDYNLNPSLHWACNDTPDCAGLTEVRHVTGYYAFLDRLMERFPDLCIEQCAAGGRMIDLGTLRRGHTVFLSDMTASAALCRFHLSGANCFLPAPMLDRSLADWCETYSDAQFLSRFGGAFGISDNVSQWPQETIKKAKQWIALYKRIRQKLSGKFYPLFPQPFSLYGWDGWQFHHDADSSGIFLIFRSKSPESGSSVKLHAIRPDKEYAMINLLSGESETLPGSVLSPQGYRVFLDDDGAGVWSYAMKA